MSGRRSSVAPVYDLNRIEDSDCMIMGERQNRTPLHKLVSRIITRYSFFCKPLHFKFLLLEHLVCFIAIMALVTYWFFFVSQYDKNNT